MKRLGVLSLGFTFAGCFLGAGYVSGQELWQFFGTFGMPGIGGLSLAVLLQCIFGIILLLLARDTGLDELDRIVIRRERPILRVLTGAAEMIFMFGVCVIMYAGAGALLAQTLHWHAALGSALLCVLVTAVSLRGLGGMVSAFSLLVPLLTVMTLIFSGAALLHVDFPGFPDPEPAANPLLGNWFVSALTFVSYNLFCSIGILAPLARHIKSKKSIFCGVALGCLFLFLIALAILSALAAYPQSLAAQLPMLDLAERLAPLAGGIYAVLMLFSMFGTALSCHVAAATYLCQKSVLLRRHSLWLTTGLVLLGWLGSLAGFDRLIGIIYPLCGYCGAAAMLCILGHYRYIRREVCS